MSSIKLNCYFKHYFITCPDILLIPKVLQAFFVAMYNNIVLLLFSSKHITLQLCLSLFHT